MLMTEPLEQPHGSMTLLRRGRFIDFQDLPNSIRHQSMFREIPDLPSSVILRFTPTPQHFAHFVPRMMKLSRNLTDAHPVPMSATYPIVFVHRQHP